MADLAQEPGRRIGRYRVLRRIGVGGMAELLLAEVRMTQGVSKLVAIKRILPAFAEDPAFIRMFLDEAKLVAQLSHPNVVQVYDVGRAGSDYFYAMEYVHGVDLRALQLAATRDGGRLPLAHALYIGMSVAAALHHAHEFVGADGAPLGIVHRDVSPSNVLVTYDGAVKLVDFGIAKARARKSATTGGVVKGKAPYMSPEQCQSEELDRRSDVFSLGVLLWELTTGRSLYAGREELATMRRIVDEDATPPSQVVPDYPPDLEAIVMRALARDRQERFATADAVHHALEQFASDQREVGSSQALRRYLRGLIEVPSHPRVEQVALDRIAEGLATTRAADAPDTRPAVGAVAQADDPATRPGSQPRGRFGLGLGIGLGVAAIAVAGVLVAAGAGPPGQADAPDVPTAPQAERSPDPEATDPAVAIEGATGLPASGDAPAARAARPSEVNSLPPAPTAARTSEAAPGAPEVPADDEAPKKAAAASRKPSAPRTNKAKRSHRRPRARSKAKPDPGPAPPKPAKPKDTLFPFD